MKQFMIFIAIFLILLGTIFLINIYLVDDEIGETASFSGIITSINSDSIRLDNGKEYYFDEDTEFKASIENLKLEDSYEKGNYIIGEYYSKGDKQIINLVNINIDPVFSGKIISLNGNTAVVEVNEDEYYVRSSGDQVHVKLPNNHTYNVNDEIKVRFTGVIMESYPLSIVTVSVDGLPVN